MQECDLQNIHVMQNSPQDHPTELVDSHFFVNVRDICEFISGNDSFDAEEHFYSILSNDLE